MQPHANPSRPPRILAVEDDPELAGHLRSHLASRGFDVTLRPDADEILNWAQAETYDLILLDIMLPDGNGLEILARMRQRLRLPVILMSALGAEQDRIVGFSQGADDYLPKPFSMREMDVRIDAILRRVAYDREGNGAIGSNDSGLHFDGFRIDVSYSGIWADLSASEYRILEVLVENEGEVLSKAFLYQQAMHRPYSPHDRSLDMHVSRIRRKLQMVGYTHQRIDTVRGTGYVFNP